MDRGAWRAIVYGVTKCLSLSHVQLFVTPWTIALQAPLSMKFSRQEYCSGLPVPAPEDLPDPRIEPRSPAFQAEALPSELLWKQRWFSVNLFRRTLNCLTLLTMDRSACIYNINKRNEVL